eukprot:CAMPEP_0183298452 /NCGR_PEP_ID=MMETSP0160_2-20130417/5470_1 /TAXON_ID=2839 ORGANISM="Odontella Sinensis, Strain Grunow 1884" /NCGR_SAMPLE_ID=MMETSP0160_2 /ASSEMBLY_ACC=CAM_ASM_000250 /LENGTH=38 /DNA_ID= /DNA_START= /DNA_END= /DNA_ORIENTATION=
MADPLTPPNATIKIRRNASSAPPDSLIVPETQDSDRCN